MTVATERILAAKVQTVDLTSLQPYPKNPRVGDIQAIADSLAKNGQYRPLIVQKSTGQILGGNHTWKAAAHLGWNKIAVTYVDVDDEAAARIVLADNRTNDLATYNADLLAEVLKSIPDAGGTGYSQDDYDLLVSALDAEDMDMDAIEDIVRPQIEIRSVHDDEEDDNSIGGSNIPGVGGATEFEDDDEEPQDDGSEDLRDELGELQGILQLKEDMHFKSSNYYGIPDLKRSMCVDALPNPLDTWAGSEATPDDGVTTWVWNYGVAPRKDLPMDRAILCFYTYDTYFETFWDNPAFMTAKVLNAGIKMAVVPDFSFYSDMPCATWIFNTYRAQWLGRYFQEAGIKIIPRIQFAIDKKDSASLDFNVMGIPKNAPVVAKSSHNANTQEEFDLEVYGLQKSLEKVEPKVLLMYGGKPAQRIIDALDPVGKGLVEEVVHIFNYAHKRRGVVYDKKEGMAGMKAKDRARFKKDKTGADSVEKPAKAEKTTKAEEPGTDDLGL